jgi:hypothetical protein
MKYGHKSDALARLIIGAFWAAGIRAEEDDDGGDVSTPSVDIVVTPRLPSTPSRRQ